MAEQITASPEALLTGEQILAGLREERWQNAEVESAREMSRWMRELDRINNPSVSLASKSIDWMPYDTSLSPSEFIALEGIGIDPAVLVPHSPDDRGRTSKLSRQAETHLHAGMSSPAISPVVKATLKHDGATLILEKEPSASGFSYKIQSDSDETKTHLRDYLYEQSVKAFSERPAYQRLHKSIVEAGKGVSALTFNLNIDEDPQGVLCILNDVGALRWGGPAAQKNIAAGKTTAKEVVVHALEELAQDSGMNSADCTTAYYGKGVAIAVFLDKNNGDVSITLHQKPEGYYVETANQASSIQTEAFIDTTCAKELSDLFAGQGLTFAPAVRNIMTKIQDADRWGSIYTQLTREVAKWIGRPARTKVANIISLQQDSVGDDMSGTSEQEKEALLRESLLKIQTNAVSEPTRVLIEMMQGAVSRETYDSDLVVTREKVTISSYACFDLTDRYLEGATNGGLNAYDAEGVPMLEKTYSGKTFLTREPIQFNGVKLPAGALFSRANDDGWFFQRLTPFTFQSASDRHVFGTEVAKAMDRRKGAVTYLGGASLQHIARYVA